MKKYLTVAVLAASSWAMQAQEHQRMCGTELIKQRLISRDPSMAETFEQTLKDNVQYGLTLAEERSRANYKTTATAPIPIIFHLVLNETQISRLGGATGIQERIDSQIVVINRDYNAENRDSIRIPAGFKALYGNVGIRFALAHTAPDGSATPGYEIISTTANGIEESGSAGSGMGFAEAKFTNGAPNAWDPTKYLNVWVVQPLSNGSASSILGLTVPPSYAGYNISGFTNNEIGIVLNYGALGEKTKLTQYYITNIIGGRTLTHELGHFFEIWHVWGDDNGACPGSGGKDDGIADTPPQASATYGCPSSDTVYDACTTTGNGIMYMNYMDYVNDMCMHMFTKMQAAVMSSMISSGRESYSLTQNPALSQYPTGVNTIAQVAAFQVYPNPSSGVVHISGATNVLSINVMDMQGRLIQRIQPTGNETEFTVDMSAYAKGMYMIQCKTDKGNSMKKIMLE